MTGLSDRGLPDVRVRVYPEPSRNAIRNVTLRSGNAAAEVPLTSSGRGTGYKRLLVHENRTPSSY